MYTYQSHAKLRKLSTNFNTIYNFPRIIVIINKDDLSTAPEYDTIHIMTPDLN